MAQAHRDISSNSIRLLGVAALAVVLSMAGYQSHHASNAAQSRASFDADASGTLDFADIARELNGTLGPSYVRFYVDAIERSNRGGVELPTPREAAGGTVVTAAITSRDRDHHETPSIGQAYTLPDLDPVSTPREENVALARSACCVNRVRGPPTLS